MVEKRRQYLFRRWWWHNQSLVFVDESGVNLSLTRAQGWALRGQRVVDAAVHAQWKNYTVIAGLRQTGIVAPFVLPGAMNMECLRTWTRTLLGPTLQPGDIVVWDNLTIHTDPQIAEYFSSIGVRLEFLPPYSPDLNPIEKAWSKMKTILRNLKARTYSELVEALETALLAISIHDCNNWFHHAGYTLP